VHLAYDDLGSLASIRPSAVPNAAKGYPEFPRKIFQAAGVPISTPKISARG